MTTEEQVKIIRELISGVEELNGEYQEGWEKEIADGYRLIKHLYNKK